MDTPITRAEHEEFKNTINVKFDLLIAEDKRLGKRLEKVEDISEQLSAVNVTLQKQTDNIASLTESVSTMVQQQGTHDVRIRTLEQKEGEDAKRRIHAFWGYLGSAAVGAIFTLAVYLIQRLIL